MQLDKLVIEVLKVSEKAANLARVVRSEEALFELLVQEKKGDQCNKRFVQDFKTLADVLVQETVRHDLGIRFGHLADHIRGEESNKFTNTLGETVVIRIQDSEEATAALLCNVLDGNEQAAALLARVVHEDVELTGVDESSLERLGSLTLPDDSVGVWIDPIDSTAQYIYASDGIVSETGIHSEGLRCVVVLIGAYNLTTGQPIFGCTNQPFVRFDAKLNRWMGRCVWGVSYNGFNTVSANMDLIDGFPNHPHAKDSVALSTSEDMDIQSKLSRCFKIVYAAGAGYKILCTVDQLASSYLLSKGSTFKWDTCSPHAILRAQGGGIVDFGRAIEVARNHLKTTSREELTTLLDECQLRYHQPNPSCDPKSVDCWGNSSGIIAYGSTDTLIDVVNALIKCDSP